MKKSIFFLFSFLLILFAACDNDDEIVYMLPKDYLPAYPQSFWDYSNGQRVIVANNYEPHSYQADINSPAYTATKYVPVLDGRYLYEYSVYQNSISYPLKQLLSESNGSTWVVNEANNEVVYRKVISINDSIEINLLQSTGTLDSTFKNVITVVEYLESNTESNWNLKEYYAKGVGLLRVDINNPVDDADFVIQKQLINYSIIN